MTTGFTVAPDPVRDVARRVYQEFPEMREALMNPQRRQRLFNLLLPLVSVGNQHTSAQCIERVTREGWHVTSTPGTVPPRQRSHDRPTSVRGAEAVAFRADSQKARLLTAFVAAGDAGLNAIEACRAAGLSEKSCYWKRVSELNYAGLIERMEDAHGNTVTRPGDYDVDREVYVVTPAGQGRHSALED